MVIKDKAGKLLYALIFCTVLPALLVLWARELTLTVPMGDWKLEGMIISGIGFALVLWGMYNLWAKGGGLPMNGYPPPNYVQSGAYKIFNHPIYVGFCLLCAGVSCMYKSSSGLFLITPIVTLSCWALVIGYEGPDLKKRFGNTLADKSLFRLVEHGEDTPTFSEKLFASLSSFIPWMLLYELLIYLDVSNYFIDTTTSLEKKWPVFAWAEIPYAMIYVFVSLVPFVQKSKTELRAFMLNAWWATSVGIFLQFVLPFYASQRPVESSSGLGFVIQWERGMDSSAAAFPSFHVIWALIAAVAWAKSLSSLKWLSWTLAFFIALSCSLTGNHSVADIIAGFVVFAVVVNREAVWKFIQQQCEVLANSWKAWNVGPIRIINHFLYPGLAAFFGAFIVCQFISDSYVILIMMFSTLLGGAVWGQLAEGSTIMLRPFGYYGAIAGGMVGSILCYWFFGTSLTLLMAAFAMASPLIQAIGRLRCLVQGCCHGAITNNWTGIRYWNEHSRVCQISGMKGVLVHNTQLYSIIGNFISGAILWRLWYGGSSISILIGLYFMMNGIARFVEEGFRGEVQTKVYFKLRLYQWLAIAFLFLGVFVTTIHSEEVITFTWRFDWKIIGVSLLSGLVSAFAMSIDFPKSKVPFSRLTG